MAPIGYYYSLTRRAARLDAQSEADAGARQRSVTETVSRDHDMALGVLLMTIVVAVPVLITAVFLLVFRF